MVTCMWVPLREPMPGWLPSPTPTPGNALSVSRTCKSFLHNHWCTYLLLSFSSTHPPIPPSCYHPHHTPHPGTLHPAPCTLHPAPCTLHPAPCTLPPDPTVAGGAGNAAQPRGSGVPAQPDVPLPRLLVRGRGQVQGEPTGNCCKSIGKCGHTASQVPHASLCLKQRSLACMLYAAPRCLRACGTVTGGCHCTHPRPTEPESPAPGPIRSGVHDLLAAGAWELLPFGADCPHKMCKLQPALPHP